MTDKEALNAIRSCIEQAHLIGSEADYAGSLPELRDMLSTALQTVSSALTATRRAGEESAFSAAKDEIKKEFGLVLTPELGVLTFAINNARTVVREASDD